MSAHENAIKILKLGGRLTRAPLSRTKIWYLNKGPNGETVDYLYYCPLNKKEYSYWILNNQVVSEGIARILFDWLLNIRKD